MDQNLPHDAVAITAISDWMSVERLAEERWETPLDAKMRSEPAELSEDELPF